MGAVIFYLLQATRIFGREAKFILLLLHPPFQSWNNVIKVRNYPYDQQNKIMLKCSRILFMKCILMPERLRMMKYIANTIRNGFFPNLHLFYVFILNFKHTNRRVMMMGGVNSLSFFSFLILSWISPLSKSCWYLIVDMFKKPVENLISNRF